MQDLIKEAEEEYRKIFPQTMSTTKYEGSYMLNVPYEEPIHFMSKWITKSYEAGKLDGSNYMQDYADKAYNQAKQDLLSQLIKEMPEERGTGSYTNSHEAIMNGDVDYGYNKCLNEITNLLKSKLDK